jgi:hypothetical protein
MRSMAAQGRAPLIAVNYGRENRSSPTSMSARGEDEPAMLAARYGP